MDTVNARIRDARKLLKKTQKEFAASLGMSENFIWQIEKEQRSPSDRTISDICRIFGIDEVWLRTGEGQPFLASGVDDRIAASLATAASHSETPKQRILRSLAKLPDDRFYAMEDFILSWLEENKDRFQSPKG